MKTANKILTYAASVMMVIAIVVCLMRGEWLDALLLSALLMAEWIINKQSELIEKVRKIGEEIAHKTIESQRQEVSDLQSTITALEAQLEAAQSQITTLKAKLSRKPRKPFPQQNVTPVKVEG